MAEYQEATFIQTSIALRHNSNHERHKASNGCSSQNAEKWEICKSLEQYSSISSRSRVVQAIYGSKDVTHILHSWALASPFSFIVIGWQKYSQHSLQQNKNDRAGGERSELDGASPRLGEIDSLRSFVVGVGVTAPPPVREMRSGRNYAHPYFVAPIIEPENQPNCQFLTSQDKPFTTLTNERSPWVFSPRDLQMAAQPLPLLNASSSTISGPNGSGGLVLEITTAAGTTYRISEDSGIWLDNIFLSKAFEVIDFSSSQRPIFQSNDIPNSKEKLNIESRDEDSTGRCGKPPYVQGMWSNLASALRAVRMHPKQHIRPVVEVRVGAGLCNQLFGLLRSCWIAKETKRGFVIPELINRPTALSTGDRPSAIRGNYLVPFSDLFDVTLFARAAYVYGSVECFLSTEGSVFPGTTVSIDPMRGPPLSQSNLPSVLQRLQATEADRIIVRWGLCGFADPPVLSIDEELTPHSTSMRLTNKFKLSSEQYKFHAFFAGMIKDGFRPSAQIKAYLSFVRPLEFNCSSCLSTVPTARRKWALHVRLEADWPVSLKHDEIELSQLLQERSSQGALFGPQQGDIVFLAGSCTPTQVLKFKQLCPEFRFVTKRSGVKEQEEIIGAQAQTNLKFATSIQTAQAERGKEESLANKEDQRNLSFETSSVIDMQLALECDGFIGHFDSSWSGFVALQFWLNKKPYGFYGKRLTSETRAYFWDQHTRKPLLSSLVLQN